MVHYPKNQVIIEIIFSSNNSSAQISKIILLDEYTDFLLDGRNDKMIICPIIQNVKVVISYEVFFRFHVAKNL